EAKFIVRATIGDLRVGVAEGIIRDAIAKAFLIGHENLSDTPAKLAGVAKDAASAVEWAWFLRPDYGEVAEIARDRGINGLEKVKVEVGKPYHVLLAERSPGLKEAIESFEKVALEYKFDGARLIIHKKGNKIWLFTRRLENITKQFPELHGMVAKAVDCKECIIEGEMLGFNKATGKPMPFQFLSQRIKRKYDIDRMVKEIPIQVNLFEIVYLDGRELFDEPLSERWRRLKSIIRPIKGKFQLAEHLETKDLKQAEKFYKESLAASQEGLIVKNLDARYQPGRRVAGGWLKVKPVMETLDLAIIGATWGTGKRAGWFGSLLLGARDAETGKFLRCGMIGTGIKEKKEQEGDITFEELTKMLKPNIIEQHGSEVILKPDVVVEVAYEEIQKSPDYDSGVALRFPRVVKFRPDKNLDECDSTERIRRLYGQQKGKIRG
ncbi:MAG: ATP-dependent DNA ligase, partial [Candidatus Aenigmarchaeota archaeon]|nr:ATP-dependent DNA ligase [Candidatus Aenigmarchaeota archaeon]